MPASDLRCTYGLLLVFPGLSLKWLAIDIYWTVNPFYALSLFLYLLKTPEKQWFCDVFRGYKRDQLHRQFLSLFMWKLRHTIYSSINLLLNQCLAGQKIREFKTFKNLIKNGNQNISLDNFLKYTFRISAFYKR